MTMRFPRSARHSPPFGLAASRHPSPWPSPAGRGNGHPAASQFGRRSHWHRALTDSTPRRQHNPARSIRHAAAGDSPSPQGRGLGGGGKIPPPFITSLPSAPPPPPPLSPSPFP